MFRHMDNIIAEIRRKIKRKEQQVRELEEKKAAIEAEILDARARLDEQNQLLSMGAFLFGDEEIHILSGF
jgi:predicted  nucleic acid-binding Zn-ribbon protein